jgi:glycosyltransferase involved in cell wall biosynthesis
MKIVILSTAYPLRGGIAHFIGLLYKELMKANQVKVITFKRQYPSILFPGKSQIESADTVEQIPAEVLVDSINPFNWIAVGLMIRKQKPDLLIFKFWMPFFAPCFGTISRLAKKNNITKVLTICDNVIPHERKIGDLALIKYFFKTVDYFVLLSEKVRTDLLTLKPGAVNKFLPHPVYSNFGIAVNKNEAKKHLSISADRLILFFGFIRDYKGLDILLNAMALLKNGLDVKLVIAGEFYSNEDKYLKTIDDLGIKENLLMFTDFIPTSDVKYYFSAADCIILPYRNATQSGIVQIATNFSKPVIAADVGGLSEVIENGKTGFIVEKENPKALAEAIKKFYIENREKEFVENIALEVKKYSWENFVNGLSDLVRKSQE